MVFNNNLLWAKDGLRQLKVDAVVVVVRSNADRTNGSWPGKGIPFENKMGRQSLAEVGVN